MGSDAVLGEQAIREYRRRLAELDIGLAEADVGGDAAKASRLNAEREALVKELSSAYGLGGRPRSLGGGNERARKTVTARVHDTLGRIDVRHPLLGRHLRESIVTGTFCSYRPADDIRWSL